MQNSSRTSGFTLIELSIVIVVIALIAAGVLVGRDLVKSAQLRSTVSQVEQLNTAVSTFRLKYSCLPGDCVNATQFLSATAPAVIRNGNGDGLISFFWGAGGAFQPDENSNFDRAFWMYPRAEWLNGYQQLAAANLIDLPPFDDTDHAVRVGVHFPLMKFQSAGGNSDVVSGHYQSGLAYGYMAGYQYLPAGHKLVLGPIVNGAAGYTAGMNYSEAQWIDAKIDDGLPYTGNTLLISFGYPYRIPGGTFNATGYCANSVTNRYISTYQIGGGGLPRMRTCSLAINAAF